MEQEYEAIRSEVRSERSRREDTAGVALSMSNRCEKPGRERPGVCFPSDPG